MGKLHVFEEIDERIPKRGEVYLSMGTLLPLLSTVDPDEDDYKRTILRRLTDAEVDALVTTKPADDERERFVRECAMRFMVGLTGDVDECVAEAMHAAESLAARLWEKK